MGWVISFAFLLTAITPLGASVLEMINKVESLSELDADLAQRSDELSKLLTSALQLNPELTRQQFLCEQASDPRLKAVHVALGRALALVQDQTLAVAQGQLALAHTRYDVEQNLPTRRGLPLCGIPAVLSCSGGEMFIVRSPDNARAGGTAAFADRACREVKWEYADSRVRPL